MDTPQQLVQPTRSTEKIVAVGKSFLRRQPSKLPSRRRRLLRRVANEVEDKGGRSPSRLLIPFVIHATAVVGALALYARLHRIDVVALLDIERPVTAQNFGFIGNDSVVGGIIEVSFWAFVATTLRWMRLGLVGSKSSDFQISRHLVEWGADSIATPIITGVIVYAVRSWRLTSGQTVNLSLEDASIGWFIVIGFLLGFFDQARRLLLNRLKNHTFGARDSHKSRVEKKEKGNDRAARKLRPRSK